MQIDVPKAIKELLYEKDVVIIPGLGALITSPAPASVDYVQGAVSPPSKKIEFNPNLVTNDGVLARYIEEHYTVSFREAVHAISQFVAQAKETLEKKEIVEIPGVGRIYSDYEDHLRLIPDETNFAADSFGLPPVDIQPVTREKESKQSQTAAHSPIPESLTTEEPEEPAPRRAASPWTRYVPWLVGGLAIVAAVVVFVLISKDDSQIQLPDTDRVNVSPRQLEGSAQADRAPSDDIDHVEQPESRQDAPAQTDESATQPPPTQQPAAPPTREAFIVIHSFGVQRNAERFSSKLQQDGYQAETRLWKGLHRVGILFPYTRTAQIDSIKQVLGARYESQPKLFEELEN